MLNWFKNNKKTQVNRATSVVTVHTFPGYGSEEASSYSVKFRAEDQIGTFEVTCTELLNIRIDSARKDWFCEGIETGGGLVIPPAGISHVVIGTPVIDVARYE